MQRTAQCGWIWGLRCCSLRITDAQCPCLTSSRAIAQMDFPSAPHQKTIFESTSTSCQSSEELRQKNCWKLWKYRGLPVEQISLVLKMRQETIISNILKLERTTEHVDWSRLSKLVGLTALTIQAIFMATMRANSDVNCFCTWDTKNLCCQSVSHLQINLVHAMVERGLKLSEILHLSSFTIEGRNNVEQNLQVQNYAFASSGIREKSSCAAFSECSSGEKRLSSETREERKMDADFENSAYALEGAECQKTKALADYLGLVTDRLRQKLSTMFNLVWWLQKNQTVLGAFTDCEEQHMLLLLLELLEGTAMFVKVSMLKTASEDTSSRVKIYGRSPFQTDELLARMHRALCLQAVLLGVLIHAPKRRVEFVVRSLKKPVMASSNVYHVHISESPSCTCADFVRGGRAGYYFRPCKHLFYIYMVQLSIEKNLEHLMFQGDLMEEDLEGILDGYY